MFERRICYETIEKKILKRATMKKREKKEIENRNREKRKETDK